MSRAVEAALHCFAQVEVLAACSTAAAPEV